jgi:uncharacterized protein YndB with AHSA1/START domain
VAKILEITLPTDREWEMPVCSIDLRVGGKYRYEWVHKGRSKTIGLAGVFREVVKPERIEGRR